MRKLPTVIPATPTVTFHRPTTTVVIVGTLFDTSNRAGSSTWKQKPAAGNKILTGVSKGVDCVLKVYGGVGDSGTPSSLQIMLRTEVEALTKLRNCYAVVDLLHADGQALWSNGARNNERHSAVLTEKCHLGNVSMLVPSRGGLPMVLARSLFDQLLFAIEFCHLHRVANTDVCLENMLIHSSGELRLTGFSRAKLGGGARQLEKSHVLDRETGRRSATSTLGRYAWPPELRSDADDDDDYDDDSSDNRLTDDEDDDDILRELRERNRKRNSKKYKPKTHDTNQYDAYAGDVWSAAICLLVMCTGRAPFVSLALPPTPQQLEDNEKPVDWALNAWREGDMGRRRFWEMLVSLQPSLLPELSRGFDDLLNGMMHIEPWNRLSAKHAHVHRWTRVSGNHAKPETIRKYVVNMIHPTLHGVSGNDNSKELAQSAEMIRNVEEFSRRMIGNDEDDGDDGSYGDNGSEGREEKEDHKDEGGEPRKKLQLGNSGLSFYQANVYAVRNAKRTAIEQIKKLNQAGKSKESDNVDPSERSALAQLGVQRAKQLAAEDNDVVYPHLETMWSRSLGKQIMIRMPPLPKTGEETKLIDPSCLNKTVDLKQLEKQLVEASKEIINVYLRDHQTVLEIKKLMAARVVEEHPARWFDYEKHTLCLCGKPLPDDMVVGSSTMFNRGNTVFRLFPSDDIPRNETHSATRARLKEGRGYVKLFDHLAAKCRESSLPINLNHKLYGSDSDDDDDDEGGTSVTREEELRIGHVQQILIVRALMTGRLPRIKLTTKVDAEAESALRLLASRLNNYKVKHEMSTKFLSDQWCERVTGPEFMRMCFRLREEVIAHDVFDAMQHSGTVGGQKREELCPPTLDSNDNALLAKRKVHTRMTKGTAVTALTENAKVRLVMSRSPEMDMLHQATRDQVAEAIRKMKTGAGSKLIGELDILNLMRTYGAKQPPPAAAAETEDGSDVTSSSQQQEHSSIHYLSWKNALETQDFAWRFTGKYSKAAENKRHELEEQAKRREKRRLEQQNRLKAKRFIMEKKRARKAQVVATLKARYGVLSDYFSEFGLAPPRMDYRKFMAHCVQVYRVTLANDEEKVGKHWGEGALTGEYIIKYNTQNYRNLQGLKAQETHLRRVDVKKGGMITLIEFMEALKNMEWVHNAKSAEEAFTPFVVDDIF